MDFNDYQELSQTTAQGYANPELQKGDKQEEQMKLLFLAVALNGEAGEVGEKVKKAVREDKPSYLDEARAELGDVLWYLTQLTTLLDVELEDVAEENMDKLLDRQERNMITGQGDNR